MDELEILTTKTRKIIKVKKVPVEQFIQDHDYINYCSAIISSNCMVGYVVRGHLNTLINELGVSEDEFYNMVPEYESPLYWLVYNTGYVAVWYDSLVVSEKITDEQRAAVDRLKDKGIVSRDCKEICLGFDESNNSIYIK